LEFERRRDVHTLDAYAWALHRNGRSDEGRKHVELALAVGVRDPRMQYHAGAIAAAVGDGESARRYLLQTLETSCSDVESEARSLLDTLR
jgi:hypothetical protein